VIRLSVMSHDDFEDEWEGRDKPVEVRSTSRVGRLTVVRDILGGITDCLVDIEKRIVILEKKEVLRERVEQIEKRLNKQSAIISLVFGSLVTAILMLAYVIYKLDL